ncbi:MAG: hypothetical protein K2P38_10760, partial [Lachnospiraceae bacterium]|nr:hypothetical protein [Lachnospiraceae bacterium]
MNDSQNWNVVGEQMKNALSDALRTGDFANLNELVSQTVTDTLNEAGKQFANGLFSQPEKETSGKDKEDRIKMQQEQQAQRRRQQEEERKARIQQQKEEQRKRQAAKQAQRQQFDKKKQVSVSPKSRTAALIHA